jgi:hypothetical protein
MIHYQRSAENALKRVLLEELRICVSIMNEQH